MTSFSGVGGIVMLLYKVGMDAINDSINLNPLTSLASRRDDYGIFCPEWWFVGLGQSLTY